MTNDVLKKALRFTGKMGVIASEEEDTPVDVLEDDGIGSYESQVRSARARAPPAARRLFVAAPLARGAPPRHTPLSACPVRDRR